MSGIAIILFLLPGQVFAQVDSALIQTTETDVMLSEPVCRDRAKEAAKKHYDLCMRRVRQQEMKRLHEDYSERIENLKKEYEDQILKLKEEESDESP